MKYTIVIPTYNNCDKLLKPCIESIIKHTDMDSVQLIVSANGCTDNTRQYLDSLAIPNLKIVWNDKPIGFIKAVNCAIKESIGQKIIILNNDTIILDSPKDFWIKKLDVDDVSGVLSLYSEITKRKFLVFFCVMIDRIVFDKIGLLDEQFGLGGCDDIDFCYRAEEAGFKLMDVGFQGDFPIYHIGEGTFHQPDLIDSYKKEFAENEYKLAKKWNTEHYYYMLSNNYERAIFLKGDPVFPRETTRYLWANQNLYGNSILEIGCSTGYGCQFFPRDMKYYGVDYDPIIISVAKEQQWGDTKFFFQADINQMQMEKHDTVIAFEVIEHLDNGLDVVKKLQNSCKRLLITVPHNEPKGFWGEHHKLHGLTEADFPGFTFAYINEAGQVSDKLQPVSETNRCNLMLCRYDA